MSATIVRILLPAKTLRGSASQTVRLGCTRRATKVKAPAIREAPAEQRNHPEG
jgi:hypothetical protein